MTILIIGLVLFIGVHFVPAFTGLRARLRASLGEGRYKGLYSLVAAIGLGLIIWGYGLARYNQPLLWNPPAWGPHLTAFLMFFSIVLLAAADISGKIKEVVRHPMITGVGIWGIAHLASNG
ncbi:MAG: NnrU family protein, partial [Fimbriimonadaceae bacterium]|nr:NnrU family protein [Alphaproteobacteria bacterium]